MMYGKEKARMALNISKGFWLKVTGLKNINRFYLSDQKLFIRHRNWMSFSLMCMLISWGSMVINVISLTDMARGFKPWAADMTFSISLMIAAAATSMTIWSFNKGIAYLKVSDAKEQTKKGLHEALKDMTLESQWATDWKNYVSNDLKRELYIMDLEMMKYLSTCERDMNWRRRVYGTDAKPHPLEEKQRIFLGSSKEDPKSLLNLQKSIDKAIGQSKMSLWPR